MKVSLFVTCLVDQLYPQVGMAATDLLERLGVEVDFDPRQTCCGQPAFNSGYPDEARRVAVRLLDLFENVEAVVVPSGSCATMIVRYLPDLFEDRPQDHARALELGKRTFELSDFLVNQLGVRDVGAAFEETVTFHDSCHQLRELGIYDQPRVLIRSVRGVRFLEMDDSTHCCGFGGTFAVKFADVSAAIGEEKVEKILGSGARYVVSNDVSCLMHIDGLLKRRGLPILTLHLAELLQKRT
jgi:L-lactate dehydrogenase complex protein LldE